MDSERLCVLKRHYEEAIAWGFPMDHILNESDVDFLFTHIDAQAERIQALIRDRNSHAEAARVAREERDSARRETATAIAVDIREECVKHVAKGTRGRSLMDICRAHGAVL